MKCELLESRLTPSGLAAAPPGAFMVGPDNHLLAFDGSVTTDTGGFTLSVAAGLNAGGGYECWFRDGNNRVWRYNNGVFLETNAFASAIRAGASGAVFTDGSNQLWTMTQQGVASPTGAYALNFDEGFDHSLVNTIVFTDGNHALWTMAGGVITQVQPNNPGYPTVPAAYQVSAGQDIFGGFQFWFTDSTGRVWEILQTHLLNVNAYATQLAAGIGVCYFTDANGAIYEANDFTSTRALNASATLLSASPQFDNLFFVDGNSVTWEYLGTGFVQVPGG